MVSVRKRIAAAVLAVAASAACLFALFLPLPREEKREKTDVFVRWESGESSAENYAYALSVLSGIEEGEISLTDGTRRGTVAASEEFSAAVGTLERGDLSGLLFLDPALTPIERAAVWKQYGERGYYAGEFFAWNGSRVFRTERSRFDEVFLSAGALPAGLLQSVKAKKLVVGGDAELTGGALRGSAIETAEARAPYFSRDGAIFRKTNGGVRLVAVLPSVKVLEAAFDFLDDGALSACGGLEKIDFCSVPAERIGQEAFADCLSLEFLHTTVENPVLAGNFRKSVAPCGCYLYERE